MEIEEKTAAAVYETVRVKLREALEHHATLTDQLEDAAGLVQSMQLACKAAAIYAGLAEGNPFEVTFKLPGTDLDAFTLLGTPEHPRSQAKLRVLALAMLQWEISELTGEK